MVANSGPTATMMPSNGNRSSGHLMTLNIHVPRNNLSHTMQFDVQMFIGEVCRAIQEHLALPMDHDRK
jgi:hypothetical protein